AQDGAQNAATIETLVAALTPPRAVWIMLPAGETTESAIGQLRELLQPGDTVIDGGNTFWRDDLRRANELNAAGIHHIDVGTSGGKPEAVQRLAPIFATLAPGGEGPPQAQGWLHVGGHGSGHFVKMIHNGIEYALMQAYAEGFQILQGTA